LLVPLGARLVSSSAFVHSMAEVLVCAARKGLKPQTVIDVGVAHGTPELYAAFPDAGLLLIEPLTEWEPVMRSILAKRPGDYVVAAAGDSEGEAEMLVPEVLAWARLTDASTDRSRVRSVPVTTVDAEVKRLGLPGPFVLKVDVEGHEAEVIAGARETLTQCDAVLLEGFLDRTFLPQLVLMDEAGFVVHDFYGFGYNEADGTLGQVDTMFVRQGSPLRAGGHPSGRSLDAITADLLRKQKASLRNAP